MVTRIYLNQAEDLQFAALSEGAQILNRELLDAGRHPAVLVSKDGRLCTPNVFGDLEPCSPHSLAVALRAECVPVRPGKENDGEPSWREEPKIPRDLTSAYLDSKIWRGIPQVKQIASAPIIRPDWTVRWEAGWDEETGCWVTEGHKRDDRLVDSGFDIRRVFSLFPFVDERLVADCIAAALTPLLSTAIQHPHALPAFLVTARKPASGKSELAKLCSIMGGGGKQFTTWRNSEEMQKLIASYAAEDKRTVIFDNIKRTISSSDLESAITSRSLSFRTMATHSSREVACNTSWFFTANGASMSQDLQRRSIIALLDRDSHYKGWEEKNESGVTRGAELLEFVSLYEDALVTLLCSMVENWRDAGSPLGTVLFSGFERWSRVVSGVLDVCGVEGFWQARDEIVPNAVQTDEDDEIAVVEAIADLMGLGEYFTAVDLWKKANDEYGYLGDALDGSRKFLQDWLKTTTGGKKFDAESGGGVGLGKALSPYKDKVWPGAPYKMVSRRTRSSNGYIMELRAEISKEDREDIEKKHKPKA